MQAEEPGRPRRAIYLLPNLLTTTALFGGFYGIVAAIGGNFERAALSLFVAAVFDGLDGRVARWTKTESAFGKEYDSLSDMVSFGVAPALISYQWGIAGIADYGTAWARFGWLAAFFYAVAAALRLARFNTRTASVDKRYFEGLPSPAAAALVASFIWTADTFDLGHQAGLAGLALGFGVTALAGALMVSQFAYPSFKNVGATKRVRFASLLLVPLTFIAIAVNPPVMLLAFSGTFALSAPILWAVRRLRRRPREAGEG
jgi:CDP-diacylglycerol--serine O-phosphatidyltransferase